MKFLVSLETLGRGTFVLGVLEIEGGKSEKESKNIAQRAVVVRLVAAGFPIEKIGQVADNTSLEIGIHRVLVTPIHEPEWDLAVNMLLL